MSLLGLVRHLAEVERDSFRNVMAGQGAPRLFCSDTNRDGDFDGAIPDPQVVAEAWDAADSSTPPPMREHSIARAWRRAGRPVWRLSMGDALRVIASKPHQLYSAVACPAFQGVIGFFRTRGAKARRCEPVGGDVIAFRQRLLHRGSPAV